MAKLICWNGPLQRIEGPFTLTRLEELVGGFVKFRELPCGDILAENAEDARLFVNCNKNAEVFAGRCYGDVVMLNERELA